MKSALAIGILLLGSAFCSTASAGDASGGWWLWPGISLHPPCCSCCDDYCPKPLPCTAPYCCFGCDNYCPKPIPCTAPYCCFHCDDYCPKPCPVVQPLCCGPNYTCGPSNPPPPAAGCGQSSGCNCLPSVNGIQGH